MKDRSGETEEMEDEMEIPFETADAIENGTDGIGNAPEKEKEAGGQSDGVQKPREKEDNKPTYHQIEKIGNYLNSLFLHHCCV